MTKLMMVVGTMLVAAGCAGSAEDSTSSLTSALNDNASSSSGAADTAGDERAAEGERGHRHGPPPEAFTACEGKAAGDACSVTTPKGEELAGTCASPPADAEDTRIACRPNEMPEGGPPPGRGGGDCQKGGGKPADSADGPS